MIERYDSFAIRFEGLHDHIRELSENLRDLPFYVESVLDGAKKKHDILDAAANVVSEDETCDRIEYDMSVLNDQSDRLRRALLSLLCVDLSDLETALGLLNEAASPAVPFNEFKRLREEEQDRIELVLMARPASAFESPIDVMSAISR